MTQYGVFPAHPERASAEPAWSRWSTGTFVAWLIVLVGAAVEGTWLTIETIPPGKNLFESPALYWTIIVLMPLAAAAGWYVPKASYYWGLAVTPPYLYGFGVSRAAAHPVIGADLSILGLFFLLGLLLLPAVCGLAAGLSRRALK